MPQVVELISGGFAVIVVLFGGFAYMLNRIATVERAMREELREHTRLRHEVANHVHVILGEMEDRVMRRVERLESDRGRMTGDD